MKLYISLIKAKNAFPVCVLLSTIVTGRINKSAAFWLKPESIYVEDKVRKWQSLLCEIHKWSKVLYGGKLQCVIYLEFQMATAKPLHGKLSR